MFFGGRGGEGVVKVRWCFGMGCVMLGWMLDGSEDYGMDVERDGGGSLSMCVSEWFGVCYLLAGLQLFG